MVVIECPYCDEDIEMDDDASGLFDCPYCDQEFEWGTDEEEEEEEYIPARNRTSKTPKSVYIDYPDNPTLRLTAGVIFSIVMGIYAVLSLFLIFGGLFVASVESDIGDATGVETGGIGIVVVLIGFVMLGIYSTGIYFGVQMAKGRFFALIVCSVVSVLSLIMTFVTWATEDGDECTKWEADPFSGWEQCVEWGSAPFPWFDVVLWTGMIAMLASLIFVPKFRSQFY
ncbi:MAG: hypothetical protein CMA11_03585 [Euryarchaeota archaeon]|nr:hypothetical protein [Euryarchaeota archaeon]